MVDINVSSSKSMCWKKFMIWNVPRKLSHGTVYLKDDIMKMPEFCFSKRLILPPIPSSPGVCGGGCLWVYMDTFRGQTRMSGVLRWQNSAFSPWRRLSCWTRRVEAPLLPGCWRSKLRASGLLIPPSSYPASSLSQPPTSTSLVSAICLHDRKRKLNGKRKLARATQLWKFDLLLVTGRPKNIVFIFSYSQEPHLVNSAGIELGLISQNLVNI